MIEKRRKKRHGSHIFLITLILTIALGSVVLGCSMIWAVGSPQLVAVKLESQLANLVEDVQAAESVLASAQSAKPVGKYDALLADEALCRQQNIYAKRRQARMKRRLCLQGTFCSTTIMRSR